MKKLGYTSLMLVMILGFDLAFCQMIVKSSDGTSVLMRVDDNGNATITAKMTAQNIAMTGQTPRQGKVLYSNDNAGNLRWSAQPTSSGQYLIWNASTNQWDIAAPPSRHWQRSSSALYPNTISDNVGIGTSNPTSRLHVNGNLRIQGIGSNSSNTRILTVDNSGNVRYRDMPNLFNNNDFRIEHYGGTYGQHDNGMKANSHWNGICGRLEMDPDGGSFYADYVRTVKTHRYWEVETVGHISTHGEARTVGCDYNVQWWNGSAWVNVFSSGVRKSYSTETTPRHYHDRILFDLNSLPDGTPIRGRVWNHNPSSNSDNSWSCGFNTGVHSNSSADHLYLGAREGAQN